MPYPLRAPRVNNNDDIVQVVELNVNEGDFVNGGDAVAAVETDKAIVEVEAERGGYVLKILPELDEKVAVGSVVIWLGEYPDEALPEEASDVVPFHLFGSRGALHRLDEEVARRVVHREAEQEATASGRVFLRLLDRTHEGRCQTIPAPAFRAIPGSCVHAR